MFSFVKTVKQPICKAFIEFTFRHIPLNFSLYLLMPKREICTPHSADTKANLGIKNLEKVKPEKIAEQRFQAFIC